MAFPLPDESGSFHADIFMDTERHKEVELIDGSKCVVFEDNGRIYPLHKYIENPYVETYLPKENIRRAYGHNC